MAYVSRQPVRFADIDRAGIVYYPRFFDFWHRALEDFFNEDVGVAYHRLIDERRIGLPIVHVEADFRRPLAHGDVVSIELSFDRLGEKSVTIRYRMLRPSGDLAAEGTIVHACIDMDTFHPVAVPADVRAAFARHLTQSGTQA